MRRLLLALVLTALLLAPTPALANPDCVSEAEFTAAQPIPGKLTSIYHDQLNTNGSAVTTWVGDGGVWRWQVRQYPACTWFPWAAFRTKHRAPVDTTGWRVNEYLGHFGPMQ